MNAASAPSRADLLARCTDFVLEEAELLDTLDLDRWLDRFHEDGVYWLPIDPSVASPLDALNLVYDDRARLRDRVARFRSGFSFAEAPESKVSHLLGNLRLVGEQEAQRLYADQPLGKEDIVVAARATVARLSRGVCDTLHGRMVWVLRPSADGFTIRVKRIDLLQSEEPLPLLTFLL